MAGTLTRAALLALFLAVATAAGEAPGITLPPGFEGE
jgi:hypothetical protein